MPTRAPVTSVTNAVTKSQESLQGIGVRSGRGKMWIFKNAPQTAQNSDINADYDKSLGWPLQQEHSELKKKTRQDNKVHADD